MINCVIFLNKKMLVLIGRIWDLYVFFFLKLVAFDMEALL